MIQIRKWSMDDLNTLVSLANNYNISKNLMDRFPYPYTSESGRTFLENILSEDPSRVLCIIYNAQVAGAIGIHPQTDIFVKNGELGYWIGEPYWGNGIASAVIPQFIEYVFSNFDINRIFARPFGNNIASQRVLEKSGFILEAKFYKTIFKNGQFEDEWVYALRK